MLALILVFIFGQLITAQENKDLSFDELNEKVISLKKAEVAWRTIDWNTCLIDGLNESKKQNKPILLWVFIDHPIDDERC